jgi:capsular exopolysaccharide synthesis family protein
MRVILVEGDLRLPKVADYLGVEDSAGLTTVLAGRADLDDVLQPYGDTGLMVLASGPIPLNPAALLGSRHMADLLARLRERADLVIIDTPPLLPVADAAVLARQTDGAIVVVKHGKTTRDHLTRGLQRLRAVDARVLGGVLTMVPAKASEFSYAYEYGYGYKPTVPEDAEAVVLDL